MEETPKEVPLEEKVTKRLVKLREMEATVTRTLISLRGAILELEALLQKQYNPELPDPAPPSQ